MLLLPLEEAEEEADLKIRYVPFVMIHIHHMFGNPLLAYIVILQHV